MQAEGELRERITDNAQRILILEQRKPNWLWVFFLTLELSKGLKAVQVWLKLRY